MDEKFSFHIFGNDFKDENHVLVTEDDLGFTSAFNALNEYQPLKLLQLLQEHLIRQKSDAENGHSQTEILRLESLRLKRDSSSRGLSY